MATEKPMKHGSVSDDERSALEWWAHANAGDSIPNDIMIRLEVSCFITRKRSDPNGEWQLTQKGVKALRLIKDG